MTEPKNSDDRTKALLSDQDTESQNGTPAPGTGWTHRPQREGEEAGRAIGVTGSAKNYAQNVKNGGDRGHGFAAEQRNNQLDRLSGKDARVVGDDNAKNGPDRIVNGTWIQSKYCSSGSKCIQQCFDDQGRFRYLTPDGRPMEIEVPADMYDSAVQAMKDRIQNGKIPGVTDPAEASKIVRKGTITYAQARRIAKFGSIEGLKYDSVRGVKLAAGAAGMSALVTTFLSVCDGDSPGMAVRQGASAGLRVGGVAWLSSVGAAQLGRTSLEKGLRPTTDAVVKKLGPKAVRFIVKGTGKNLSGAAANSHLSKLMRGNVVTGAVTVAVLSTGDVVNAFRGRVSVAQLFKNLTVTTASVAGGTGGAMAGAAAGAALGTILFPGGGTVLGFGIGAIFAGASALLGGAAAGTVSQKASKAMMDVLIEDDAKKMIAILEKVLAEEVQIALLNQKECNQVVDTLQKKDLSSALRKMHADPNRSGFARELITPFIDAVLAKRPKFTPPSDEEFLSAAVKLLEEAADEETQRPPATGSTSTQPSG
ncbi:hypothetical protein GCM10008959_31580 [Deinococcus seoulensis]|uniref:Uncharacterized protein n=1 Tax=Deinococcus seoulensis TaxID=1837379 RepID=A0ABQ2RYQ6_9DEIO|nr:hypothetical protein [Deinococcus seoulensis]GGR67090.1 hypothetical protein GCM10008959_31580 [Deinococcus seoulensis]